MRPLPNGKIGDYWGGYSVEWPDLDEHISIEGLLLGRRSSESKASLDRWLGSRMKRSGRR